MAWQPRPIHLNILTSSLLPFSLFLVSLPFPLYVSVSSALVSLCQPSCLSPLLLFGSFSSVPLPFASPSLLLGRSLLSLLPQSGCLLRRVQCQVRGPQLQEE